MLDAIYRRGILVAVATLIICLLGLVAAIRVPVQMIPDLDVRVVSVQTLWPGGTPQDVEKEILIEQETVLRSLPSLQRMKSTAITGEAIIELEFPFGVDMTEALIRVNNALSQVSDYPENVDDPRLFTDSFSSNAFMYYAVQPLPDNPADLDIDMVRDFIEDFVRPRLERVPGVSQLEVRGGAEHQVQILLDPAALAARGLGITEVRDAIRERNRDVSAGDLDTGKRRYLLRASGRYRDLSEIEDTLLTRGDRPEVRLRDVATVVFDHFEIRNLARVNGQPGISLAVRRELGSNVIDIKREMTAAVDRVDKELLRPNGLTINIISDDVRYVEASVANVWQNLIIGALLASAVLWLFFRSVPLTAIGMMGIPLCTLAAFIGLLLAGRTLNVISLAGVAFAIGMTLDNSIVVLESIEAERRRGLDRFNAAVLGVRKVWTAVLASTFTTILVFAPIFFIEQEAGQLYSDIAVAISAAILVSMIAAITLMPVASQRISTREKPSARHPVMDRLTGGIGKLIATPQRAVLVVAVGVIVTALALAFLTPAAEYLPEGEEAKTFASMIAPPGYSLEEMNQIAEQVEARLLPEVQAERDAFAAGDTPFPPLAYLNLRVQAESLRIIAETVDPADINLLMNALTDYFGTFPGMRAFAARGSIISSNDGGTRSVNVDIAGQDLATLYSVAERVFSRAGDAIEGAQINSEPGSLTLAQPLIELRPDWSQLAAVGWNAADYGYALSALTDGAFVGEFFQGDDKIDIYFFSSAGQSQRLAAVEDLPVSTPSGSVVPFGALGEWVETVDTATVRRINSQRTVTLNIIPPRSIALETGVQRVQTEVIDRMIDAGEIPPGISLDISGAADQLDATRDALLENFLIAVALSYLLMVAIFRHWGFPLIILATVPLGIGGGIMGLWVLNAAGGALADIRQPFDLITMLGFLILLGTVVNNPILIVERARECLAEGMAVADAVKEAVASRIRPVLMTTLTTTFGLAPLVLIPGAGTELYRGVGAIVLFGLLFTAVITLTVLPCLLSLVLRAAKRVDADETAEPAR